MHAHLCLVAWVFSLHPSLYFFLKSFFHLFLMFTLVPDENSMKDPLCNSSFGSMVSLDYVTPDTPTPTHTHQHTLTPTHTDPEGWRAQNFALFFPLPSPFSFFFSLFLGVFSWNFGGPGLQKHHQNSTRRPPERENKNENGGGRGKKKSEIFGGPAEGGPVEGGLEEGGPAEGGPAEGGPAGGRSRGRVVRTTQTTPTQHTHHTHSNTHTPTQQHTHTHTPTHTHTYTQVKMEDAHKLLKIPKSECPDIWIRLPRHKWPKSWSSMQDPVVLLERNLYGHPLAGLLWERQFQKVLLKYGWEKVSNWECLFVHREKWLFLSVYVGWHKNWLERNKILIRCGKYSIKKLIWENQHLSWIVYIYLGCTQRQCQRSKNTVDNYSTMFESRISAGGAEKLPFLQDLRISSWSYDIEGHATKCLERYCELANKTTQQLHKVSTPCIDAHHFKEEEMKSVGELSSTCSQIVLKCLYLARILTTRYSMVSEQARTIHHKMDQSLWQTPESIDFIYSSYMWLQTILSCGKYCQTMQIGTVSRLWLCRRSWWLEIYFWWNIVHFWKSYICSNKLDV